MKQEDAATGRMRELMCFIYSAEGYGSPPSWYLVWLEWRRQCESAANAAGYAEGLRMSSEKRPKLEDTRLRIVGDSHHGCSTQVYLNDVEISYMLTDVDVDISVRDVNKIRLTLIVGHIDIDLPIGTLELNAKGIAIHKAKRLRRFFNRAKSALAKRLRFLRLSQRLDIAETSTLQGNSRTYIPRDR